MNAQVRNPNMIYTPEEAARKLRVSPQTIRRLCRSGELRCRKVGKQWRIAAKDLMRYYDPEGS